MYTYPAYPTYSNPGLPCPFPYLIGSIPGEAVETTTKKKKQVLPYKIINIQQDPIPVPTPVSVTNNYMMPPQTIPVQHVQTYAYPQPIYQFQQPIYHVPQMVYPSPQPYFIQQPFYMNAQF